MSFRERLLAFDWVALGVTLLLALLGLAMLFSTTSDSQLFSARLVRQLSALVVALVSYLIVSFIPYHKIRRYAWIIYGLGLSSLLVVSQIGRVIRGTTSRLEILGIQIQPSELMKVALVIALAALFSRTRRHRSLNLLISGLITGAAVILILLEPDFGVSGLFLVTWAALVVFRGVNWKILAALAAGGFLTALAAWRWLLVGYQRERLVTFLDPSNDPLGAGYNIVQSIVALGSGGVFGRGLGHGPQSQLKFLPEQHTDFVLASLGEELGFVGILLLVTLYSVLLWRILKVVKETKDPFGQYLAAGSFLVILIGFFTSSGMNMGLLPVTGLPLPLISYGGSNLVGTFLLLALVQSVHLHNSWVRQPPVELA